MSLAETYAQTRAPLAGAPTVPVPNSPLNPPEAPTTVTAAAPPAPALPPLPEGWEYGPGNAPRQVAPQGWRYSAAGQLEQIPPPPAPAPIVVPTTAATSSESAEGDKGKAGRPKGATNKPKAPELAGIVAEMKTLGVSSASFSETGAELSVTLA